MKRLIIIPLILTVFSLFAAPISEKQAREIASKFFAKGTTRSSSVVLKMEWAGSDLETAGTINTSTRSSAVSDDEEMENALVYIYNRLDTKGFVVVAGDDKVKKPILAFSYDDNFDIENMPEGAKAILQGWCKQVAAARADKTIKATTRTEDADIGNVVRKYETAKWDQGAPYNTYAPVYDGAASFSGCVATSAGIVFRYFQWPTKGVGTIPSYTYTDKRGISRTIPENVLGHTYDYSKMLMNYKNGYTTEEGEMVGRLIYDIGTGAKMTFSPDGSGTTGPSALAALATHFGYSKSAKWLEHRAESEEEWAAMLQKNLDDYGPMMFGGGNGNAGHVFVLDGYTDKGYFSINYGWSGGSNGYYLLPKIEFYQGQGGGFYVKPDKDGTSEYKSNIFLWAGNLGSYIFRGIHTDATEYRVGSSSKLYIAIVNRGITEFNGQVGLAHCDTSGNIKEFVFTWNMESANMGMYIIMGQLPIIHISQTIEQGDRLIAFHRASATQEWTRAEPGSDNAFHEILLCATPQEVAKSLDISYEKSSKIFTFTSKHAIQYSVTAPNGTVVVSDKVASFSTTTIDFSTFESGKYTLSFASGGEPYTLNFKL